MIERIVYIVIGVLALIIGLAIAIWLATLPTMPSQQTIMLITVPASIIATFLPVMFVVGRLSGWARLSRRFPRRDPATEADRGKALTSIAIRWPWFGYNNCIRWAVDDDCLHLSLHPLFTFGHAPISIPWEHIETITPPPGPGRHAWGRWKLTGDGIALWVPKEMARREHELREAIQGSQQPPQGDPAWAR